MIRRNNKKINENFINTWLGTGMAISTVIVDVIKNGLKIIHENEYEGQYNINPFNVRYDSAKKVIYYKDHEECKWGPIYELKDGIICKDIDPNKRINDSEIQKLKETFVK